MSEVHRIDDQLQRMFEDAWHGPSISEVLAGVDAGTAAARPVSGAHSIWELVLHLTVWLNIPRRRLEEQRAIEATTEEDWPPVGDTGEAAWREARERLQKAYEDFRRFLSQIDDRRLEETSPGRNYPVYVTLHGVIQHLAYHAGQIALLKKAQ